MGYNGQIATIPIGRGGLVTDIPSAEISAKYLTRAINCTLVNGYAEKDFGSRNWNQTALGTGIAGFKDYWPSEVLQRVFVVGKNGLVYRFTNPASSSVVLPVGDAPTTLNVSQYVNFVLCGQEEAGNERKLFILTGNSPIQVVSGDGTDRSDIALPAADWSGTNQPFMAVQHRGELYAFGNRNDPHRVYKSDVLDHERFQGGTATSYSVFPGESQRIIAMAVHRNRLYALKYPKGLYYLVDEDPDQDNWYFVKSQETFGGSSPRCAVPFLDDFMVANQFNSLTSVAAAFTFGDFQSSDIFSIYRCKNFSDQEIAPTSFGERQGIYYESKQQVMYSFRSVASNVNDRICNLNFRDPQAAIITWNTKDRPNCLDQIQDSYGVERPCYGANDGFIYVMDQEDRLIRSGASTSAYEFQIQTPHLDLGEFDPLLSEQVKQFDSFELGFIPTGRWNATVEVFIDGKFHRTAEIEVSGRSELGQFRLGQSRLDDGVSWAKMAEVKGNGRRIGFRISNSGLGENVKISKIRIYFTVAGQEQKK